MPQTICVPCGRFYQCEKNEVLWEEGMPVESHWEGYKLWYADLWKCPGCGHQVIQGHARKRYAEHYEEDYAEKALTSMLRVSDG